ncbi:DUF6463 family protein [Hydrogenophaga sp. 5NK40-0174]|uniref:DUF6463 family protein n=1 Tax=Hydrogenophaga sp. 5NK40-0174 TaxID=3127649 RepID=UPI003104143A
MLIHRHAGRLLMAIGLIHCALGVFFSFDILAAWANAGWWHSIEKPEGLLMDRFAALWFQVAGVSWVLLGWLMQQWIARIGHLPPTVGWGLAFMAAVVAWVLPVSGAWLILGLGLGIALATPALTAKPV